jgi:hypothetical protein
MGQEEENTVPLFYLLNLAISTVQKRLLLAIERATRKYLAP